MNVTGKRKCRSYHNIVARKFRPEQTHMNTMFAVTAPLLPNIASELRSYNWTCADSQCLPMVEKEIYGQSKRRQVPSEKTS
jgi:hypothetical protein